MMYMENVSAEFDQNPDALELMGQLAEEFSLDQLDNWTTTTGLIQSAISFAGKAFPSYEMRIFYHETELHEYREIDREGVATIPDDSLFAGCLSMISEPTDLSRLFSDFQINAPMLEHVLFTLYHAHTIVPVVHRFDLLAFLLLCDKPQEKHEDLSQEDLSLLKQLTDRLTINLYAASVADQRLRELLHMAQYPRSLQHHRTITELYNNLMKDLVKEIPFDAGICYAYDEELNQLVPFNKKGIRNAKILKPGQGISGQVFESRLPLYIPDRLSNPAYALMEEEPFIEGSAICVPVSTDKTMLGVVTLIRNPENPEPFGMEHRYMLEIASAFTASEITNRQLYTRLDESNFNIVESLTRALEAKDSYTEGHSTRVTRYAEGIARELGYKEEKIHQLRYGAMLHDIGKIGIPDAIINKAASLTEDEYAEIKTHTEIGYNIVCNNPFFKSISTFIRYHHETINGKGYYGLQGNEIPEEAMIISAADIFDALTSDRPYRKALSIKESVVELKKQTGVHYTKEIFEAFMRYLKKNYPADFS